MKKIFSICFIFFIVCFSLVAQDSQKKIGDFFTTDINGTEVSQEIFSKADVTIVNIWGTYCGPCISEMPELGDFDRSLPENVQLIGIVVDVYSLKDKAGIGAINKITRRANVEFTNLLNSRSLMFLLQNIQFVPTTLLVDKKGYIIGEPVVGANVNNYRKALEAYLDGKK